MKKISKLLLIAGLLISTFSGSGFNAVAEDIMPTPEIVEGSEPTPPTATVEPGEIDQETNIETPTPTPEVEVEGAVAAPMAIDTLLVSSSKPTAPTEWVYYEDTDPITYTVRIYRDDTLPGNTLRTIKVDTNPFLNTGTGYFYIADYPKDLGYQIKAIRLSTDKQSVEYDIANDALPDSGLSLSIALAHYVSKTTYVNSAGTPAKAIGLMLLAEPNARLGVRVTDNKSPSSTKELEIKFERTGHDDSDFLTNIGMITTNGTSTSFTAENDLWLGSDGFLYAGTPIGNDTTYALRMNFSNVKHTPVGNISLKIPMPVGFKEQAQNYDSANKYNYITFSVNSSGSLSGNDLIQGQSSVSTSYQLSTSLDSSKVDMLSGIIPITNQWLAIRMTGKSTWAPNAENPIYTYTAGDKVQGAPIIGTYQQVVSNRDGTYRVENRNIDLGHISVNIPTFTYEDRFNAVTYSPTKVNEDDDLDTKYTFSIINSVNTTDVQNNIAHKFYRNEKMTFEIPNEFDPTKFYIDTTVISNYQLVYEDGTSGPVQVAINPINTPHNASGSKVAKIILTISDRGLVGSGRSSGYSGTWSFSGSFTEPKVGTAITMPVTIGDTSQVIKTLNWTYESGVDNLAISTRYWYTNINSTNPYFLNNGTGINDTAGFSIDLYSSGSTASSIKYENFEIDINLDSPAVELINKSFYFYGTSSLYKIYGQAWLEYTTNLDSNPRRLELSTSYSTSYQIPLVTGEYLTSIKFKADGFRLYSYNSPADKRQLFQFTVRNDRNNPGGRLAEGTGYNVVAKMKALGNVDGKGVFENPTAAKQTSNATPLYFIYSTNLQVYSTTPTINQGPDTATRNNIIPTSTTLYLPAYRGSSNNVGTTNGVYPQGTKVYLKVNEPYFKYVGNVSQIETVSVNGSTWLAFDISGTYFNTSTNQTITIPGSTIMATALCEDLKHYRIFSEAYIDMGPVFKADLDQYPYIKYIKSSTFDNNAIMDTNNITAGSGVTYTNKRLVPIGVNKQTLIVASTLDSIHLFPGKDTTTPPTSVYAGVHYTADQYQNLTLGLSIASADKTYNQYTIAIRLPEAGGAYSNAAGDSGTSQSTLTLRDLTNSVHIPADYANPVIKYCSAFNFDGSTTANIQANCTESTTPETTKYVLITIPVVPVGSEGVIELKLKANEADMYTLDNNAVAIASAESKFFEQLPGQAASKYVTGADSKNLGRYYFDWYTLSGKIFVDSPLKTPDGIFNIGDGDLIASLSPQFKDLDTNKLFNASYNSSTGQYTLYIQPKGTAGAVTRNKYDLIFNLKNGSTTSSTYYWNKYRMTVNTSGDSNTTVNNNFPRQFNDQTEGMQFYADVNGFNPVNYVTQDEINQKRVNVGLYQNPELSISTNSIRTKVGESITFSGILSGTGKIADTNPYQLEDGTTYASVVSNKQSDIKVDITLSGIAETLSSYNLTTKNATLSAFNFFNEPFEISSTYQVYKDTFVTFMRDDSKTTGTTVVGTWADTASSKEVLLQVSTPTATSGTVAVGDVPTVTAPVGYAFAGWRRVVRGSTSGSLSDPTVVASNKYDTYYPIFEIDVVGEYEPDGTPKGDGIPDKYQVRIDIKTTVGGSINKNATTITNTTDAFTVYKTRLMATNTTALYPVAEMNPANWTTNTTYRVALLESDIPTQLANQYYSFVGWKFGGYTWTNAAAIEAEGNVFAANTNVVTATFTRNITTVTFEENSVGQKSKTTESVNIGEGLTLTNSNLIDTLGTIRSTPAYGYNFTGWKDLDVNSVVATTDTQLQAIVIESPRRFQPQYVAKEYTVNFKIGNENAGTPGFDSYGNSIGTVTANQKVSYLTQGTGLTIPATIKTTNDKWKDVFEFAYWSYEMDCEANVGGCPATGKIVGQVSNPATLVITGNVTFYAEFAGKPYISAIQDGNGTTAIKHIDDDTQFNNFGSASFSDADYTATGKSVEFGKMSPKPGAGYYDVGLGFKANDNYRIATVTAYVLKNSAVDGSIETLQVWNRGVSNDTNIDAIIASTPVTGMEFNFDVDNRGGTLLVDNIGGLNGNPCGIIFEVSYERIPRTVTFNKGNEGTISATNTAFTSAGGVLIDTDSATFTVPHGDSGVIYPMVEANTGFAFDYWVMVDGLGTETRVSPAALANMPITSDMNFVAKYDVDLGGPQGEIGDGIPDKYQVKFVYVSQDDSQLTIVDSVSATQKVEYITRALNADGTYSITNTASPSGTNITKTIATPSLYGFKGWKFYEETAGVKDYYTNPDNSDILIDTDTNLSTQAFTATQPVYIEAQVGRVGYTVNFHINPSEGSITTDGVYRQQTDIAIGSAIGAIAPAVLPASGKTHVGWYYTGDLSRTPVNTANVTVTNNDVHFNALVMDTENVSQEGNIILTGSGFTVDYADLGTLTKTDIITNSNATSWNSVTGVNYDPYTTDEELAKIQEIGPQGGLVEVVIQSTDGTTVASRTIIVVVKGTNTPDPVGPDADGKHLGISASGFVLTNEEAKLYDALNAVIRGNAVSYIIETAASVDVDVNTDDIDAINNVDDLGGIYNQRYSATSNDLYAETASKVVVLGVQTEVTDGTSDSIALTAKGFSLTHDEAVALENDEAVARAQALSMLVKSGIAVTSISADIDELNAIKSVGLEGGKFQLTFTATERVAGEDLSVSVTVPVFVEGVNTSINDGLAIIANDFIIPYGEASPMTITKAIELANVKAYYVIHGFEIDTIEINEVELNAIRASGINGGTYLLTFTAIDPIDDTRTVTITISVTVLPKLVVIPPNPDGERTCQDDGYPAGYVWDEASQSCKAEIPGDNENPNTNPNDKTTPKVEDENVGNKTPTLETTEDSGQTPPTVTPDSSTKSVGDYLNIDENAMPFAGIFGNGENWAILNLLATIIGLIFTILLVLLKRKDVEELDEEVLKVYPSIKPREFYRKSIYRTLSIIVAVIMLGIFFLTENFLLRMVLVDEYTVLMLGFMIINIVIYFIGRKWHVEHKEEQEKKVMKK